MYSNPGNVPDGYDKDSDLGRPKDTNVKRNTQDDNFGKDRLGVKRMKDTDKNDSNAIRPKFKGGSPLALESAKTVFLKNKDIFKKMTQKKLIFEEDKDDTSLLDENQLKK